MAPSTSRTIHEPGTATKDKEAALILEITQLKSRIQERDRTIFDLEEQIRGKDAIIIDKCQLIERLEQTHQEKHSPDQDSIEENSQSTVQYVNVNGNGVLTAEQEAQLLDELEAERNSRIKLIEQNELLLQQWDEALKYIEQVQKRLQDELQRSTTLLHENVMLRNRITETFIIPKSGIQCVAFLVLLLSIFLYKWN